MKWKNSLKGICIAWGNKDWVRQYKEIETKATKII